jgi:outer membrane protein insertion porin family
MGATERAGAHVYTGVMRLILTTFLLSLCAMGQPKPRAAAAPAPASWPVEKVEVEGLRVYTVEQVRAVLGIKPGQVAGQKDFEAARKRLEDTGAFENVGFRFAPAANGKAYTVTYEVMEAGPRMPVRFEELGVTAGDLEKALKRNDPFYAPTIPATQPLLERYTGIIHQFLLSQGKTVKVVAKVEPDDHGDLAVVFRPAGGHPVVARVRFTGNTVVASPVLENAINAVAVGVPYTEEHFRQLLNLQVRALYDARGRVRVAFPEVHTQPDQDVKGLAVTVKVDEGASYTLAAVNVQGSGLPPEDWKKINEFKPGDVFNAQRLQAGAAQVEARMRREGYMHAKSSLERKIDDQAKKVTLTVRVIPGDRYTFTGLKIEGLDILTEPTIRKMWGLKEGEPFNSDYPNFFLGQVKEEGILDNLGDTKSVVKADDQTHTVQVTLLFKGEPPKPKKRDRRQDAARPDSTPGPFAGWRVAPCYRE